MRDFRKRLNKGVVVFDGAIGSLLQANGLKPGHPPEEMLLDDFKLVAHFHREYAKAGADVITTNSFGLNEIKIKEFGFEERFEEINRLAVRAARFGAGKDKFVAGDLGPTGLFVEPVGELSFDEAVRIFREQAKILVDEGVDLFALETFVDIKEMKAAIVGIREVCDLPIAALMTFDESGRGTLGSTPESAAVVLDGFGVDLIGSNCSVGARAIADFVKSMRKFTDRPLIAQPNAGMPTLKKGKTVFPDSPTDMAEWVETFLDLGCGAVGSCCGSTPAHTAAIAKKVKSLAGNRRAKKTTIQVTGTAIASRSKVAIMGPGKPCLLIGERINPTRRKDFGEELKRGDLGRIRREARLQEASGADVLDVNVGVPGIDEAAVMREAVFAVNSASLLPIAIDSSSPAAIEAALKACDGKPLVNSISGETARINELMPLVKKYGAAFLGLCTDEKGVPKDAATRIKIARKLISGAKKRGIDERNIMIDPVTVPASAEQIQPNETLAALRHVTQKLGLGAIQGVSNVSFGLPRRYAVNAAHMAMAMEAGLSATFANPLEERVMDVFHASRVLLNQDKGARDFIHYSASRSDAEGGKPAAEKAVAASTLPWDKRISRAVVDGEPDTVEKLVREALARGVDPLVIGNDALIPGIREVGRMFETQEIFLPNLLVSAEAMEKGTGILREILEKGGKKQTLHGTVVLATVEGDIHDIGKNIVGTILRTHGWNVVDMGRSAPSAKIVAEAKRVGARVIGLSALMTTTVVRMPEVIFEAKKAGIGVMVGGAVVTQDYADDIGADFYGADAMAAVRGAEILSKRGK